MACTAAGLAISCDCRISDQEVFGNNCDECSLVGGFVGMLCKVFSSHPIIRQSKPRPYDYEMKVLEFAFYDR